MLLDAVDPFGRYELLPSGLLREPFRGLGRADLFLVTHAPDGDDLETLTAVVRRYNPHAPILRARHAPEALVPIGEGPVEDLGRLGAGSAYAFCGIGNPQGFRSTLIEAGARLAGFEPFADHHRFSPAEIERIAASARRAGAAFLVTTEKDGVRLPTAATHPPAFALRIGMVLGSEEPLSDRLLSLLERGAGESRTPGGKRE